MWQLAPRPVSAGHRRFAPLGVFALTYQLVHTPILLQSGCIFNRHPNSVGRVPHRSSIPYSNFPASWAASTRVIPPEPCDHRVCCVTPLMLACHGEFFFRAQVVISIRGCQTFTACAVRHLPIFQSRMRPSTRHSLYASAPSFPAALFCPCIGQFLFFPQPCLPPNRCTTPCQSWS